MQKLSSIISLPHTVPDRREWLETRDWTGQKVVRLEAGRPPALLLVLLLVIMMVVMVVMVADVRSQLREDPSSDLWDLRRLTKEEKDPR